MSEYTVEIVGGLWSVDLNPFFVLLLVGLFAIGNIFAFTVIHRSPHEYLLAFVLALIPGWIIGIQAGIGVVMIGPLVAHLFFWLILMANLICGWGSRKKKHILSTIVAGLILSPGWYLCLGGHRRLCRLDQ